MSKKKVVRLNESQLRTLVRGMMKESVGGMERGPRHDWYEEYKEMVEDAKQGSISFDQFLERHRNMVDAWKQTDSAQRMAPFRRDSQWMEPSDEAELANIARTTPPSRRSLAQ